MNTFFQDVRYAARSLRKNPGFAAIAVVTLALGIGANTAVFSLTRGILLRPLPYREADRLLFAGLSLPDFRDLRDSCRSFDKMAVLASNRYNLVRGDESEQVLGGVVSAEFFPLLGPPRLGRAFGPAEEHERVVVLSDRFWKSRFGADPSVLGRAMDIGGAPYTILGVAGPEFEFPTSEFALWVPLAAAAQRHSPAVEQPFSPDLPRDRARQARGPPRGGERGGLARSPDVSRRSTRTPMPVWKLPSSPCGSGSWAGSGRRSSFCLRPSRSSC